MNFLLCGNVFDIAISSLTLPLVLSVALRLGRLEREGAYLGKRPEAERKAD